MIKLDLKYASSSHENEFKAQQLAGLINLHQRITWYLNIILVFVVVQYAIIGNYINASVIFLVVCFNYLQTIYFRKRPSYKCLYFINAYNILIAVARFSQAIQTSQSDLEQNAQYFSGLGIMAIHLSLLVNPYIRTNFIILFIILILNLAAASIIQGRFYYEGLSLIFTMIMCGEKISSDMQIRRVLFSFQQKNISWETIFKYAVSEPFILIQYVKEEIRFNLLQSNDQAASELFIVDSSSMRNTLRDMTVIGSNQLFQTSLERYIYNLALSNFSSQDKYKQAQIIFRDDSNIQKLYETKIYSLDEQQQTFILTFKNAKKILNQKLLKETILNQQVSLCTLINQQYDFCKRILRAKSKSIVIETLHKKNQLDLLNYQEIFRQNKILQISDIRIDSIVKRIRFLFPYKDLIHYSDINECKSDQQILYQIYYNLCSFFFDDHKCQNITITSNLQQLQTSELINLIFQVDCFSKGQKKLILKDTEEDQKFDTLSQIQRKGHFKYLMVKKLLAQIGPNNIILIHNHNTTEINSISLQFSFYRNSSVLENDSLDIQ